MKRWIALVLVLVMAVGALPMAALATTNTPLGTYEWMEEQYGTEAATKWKWLLNNYNAKYADVYDLLCHDDSDEAENFYYYCSPEALAEWNSWSPTKQYTQEDLFQRALDSLRVNQIGGCRAAYCYLTSDDPSAVIEFRHALPYYHPGYLRNGETTVYTEAEMKEKYGEEAARQWKWLLDQWAEYGLRYANVYSWYCETAGTAAATHFWFLYSNEGTDPCPDCPPLSEPMRAYLRHQLTYNDAVAADKEASSAQPTEEPSKTPATSEDDPTPTPSTEPKQETTTDTPTKTETTTFVDVKPGAWYYDAVMALAESGIVAGKGNGVFDPNAYITVGEMATLICKLDSTVGNRVVSFEAGETMTSELYGTRTFNTPTSWAHESIMAVTGYYCKLWSYNYPTWDPEASAELVTRGEAMKVAVMFASRMTKYSDVSWSTMTWDRIRYDESISREAISDWKSWNAVSCSPGYRCDCSKYQCHEHRWSTDDVLCAYQLGIARGVDSTGRSDAHGTLTRAEVCQILYNMGITSNNIVSNPRYVPDEYWDPNNNRQV